MSEIPEFSRGDVVSWKEDRRIRGTVRTTDIPKDGYYPSGVRVLVDTPWNGSGWVDSARLEMFDEDSVDSWDNYSDDKSISNG